MTLLQLLRDHGFQVTKLNEDHPFLIVSPPSSESVSTNVKEGDERDEGDEGDEVKKNNNDQRSLQSLSELIASPDNRDQLESLLQTSGALLFRGFEVSSPSAFDRFVASFRYPPLFYVGGGSPGRDRVTGDVFTSTKWPPHGSIWMHNEMSYTTKPPSKAFFCSLVPADEKGFTPLADFRRVLERLRPDIVSKLKQRGVKYTRLYIDEKQRDKYVKLGCEVLSSPSLYRFTRQHYL